MKKYTSSQVIASTLYEQAVEAHGFIYFSGMLGMDKATNAFVGSSAAEQVQQIFKNIDFLLAKAELTRENIIKVTIFLADIEDITIVNEHYLAYFPAHKPARSCVEVANLPFHAKVEVEIIAVRD